MPRWHQAGYSLMELLVVLALFGLIAIAMSGGMRLGSRAWEKSGTQVAAVERIEGAQNFLRTLVQRIVPRDFDPSNAGDPDLFQGSQERMRFTALSPAAIDLAGLARFELEVSGPGGNRQLVMSWSSVTGIRGRQKQVLLSGASSIAFRYALLENPGVLEWRADWTGQAGAPALVSIIATFPEGTRPAWPELLIRPRISRDPSCIFDAVSLECRNG